MKHLTEKVMERIRDLSAGLDLPHMWSDATYRGYVVDEDEYDQFILAALESLEKRTRDTSK